MPTKTTTRPVPPAPTQKKRAPAPAPADRTADRTTPIATPPPADVAAPAVAESSLEPGQLLARVELPFPGRARFIARAVLPVPPGFASVQHLPKVDVNGRLAELELLARHPNGDVDLVMLRADVHAPSLQVGDRVGLDVCVRADRRALELEPGYAFAGDATCPPPFLVLVDADGRRHVADLRTLEREPAATINGRLYSAAAYRARLLVEPKAAGVEAKDELSPLVMRAWVEAGVDGHTTVEVLLVNGAQDLDLPADDVGKVATCGDLAFSTAALFFPESQGVVQPAVYRLGMDVVEPLADYGPGTWVSLCAPPLEGTAHVVLAQQARVMRFRLVPPTEVSSSPMRGFQDLGFALEGPWSWQECEADGPQRGPLHRWTSAFDWWGQASGQRAAERVTLNDAVTRLSVLKSGVFLDEHGRNVTSIRGIYGLAAPDGTEQEGEPGGWRIRPCGAFVLAQELLLLRQTELECTVDRHRDFLLDGEAILPISASAWADAARGEAVPFDYRRHGAMQVPAYRRQPGAPVNWITKARPNVSYWAVLTGQQRIDDQHEFRIAEPAATLAQLAGSRAAIFLLTCLATNAALAYHDLEHEPESWSAGQTLRVMKVDAARGENRGHGAAGRGLYEPMLTVAGAWRFLSLEERSEFLELTMLPFGELMKAIEMPNHLHQALGVGSRHYDDAVRAGMPTRYRVAQSFEECLAALALVAIARSCFPTGAPWQVELLAHARRTVDALLFGLGRRANGMAWFVATADVTTGDPLPALVEDGRTTHVEADHVLYLAWCGAVAQAAARDEADPSARSRYLSALLELGPLGANLRNFVDRCQQREREWGQGVAQYASHAMGEIQRLQRRGELP
jgi:hypothetical protein